MTRNILTLHPPVWIRNISAKSNLYRNLTSWIRTRILARRYTTKCDLSVSKEDNISIIYMADGRVPHGGLCDRIWGMVCAYKVSIDLGCNYYINHIHPFEISRYLLPNKYNWILPDSFIRFDKRCSPFYYGECKAKLNVDYFYNKISALIEKDRKQQIHLYNNLHFDNEFRKHFWELFKLSDYLKNAVDNALFMCGLPKNGGGISLLHSASKI